MNSDSKPVRWWFRKGFLVFAFLSVGPLALPLIWFHPKMSPARKITVTLLILIFTALLAWAFDWAFKTLMESLQEYFSGTGMQY